MIIATGSVLVFVVLTIAAAVIDYYIESMK